MAEIRKAAGGTPTYTITHEDGSTVTPQEFYDAFMSGTVILEEPGDGGGYESIVLSIDYSGTPDNVTGCVAHTSSTNITISG